MNLIRRILDYSYHARDVRALDPATGKPIPRAGNPSILIRIAARLMNASWAKRNLLKYVYTFSGPAATWLSTHFGADDTKAIIAWAITGVTFMIDRLASWLSDQATMKIPPRVGAPTAEQERESIEAYERTARPSVFTPKSFLAVEQLTEDEKEWLAGKKEMKPLPDQVPPAAQYNINVDGEVHPFTNKQEAIAFKFAQIREGKNAKQQF
jgi:hypothetical protein